MSGLPSGEVPDIYCQGVSRLIDAGKTDDAACLATCGGISNCNIAVTIQTSSQVECYGFQTCSGSTAPNSVTDSRTIRWYRKTAGGQSCANGYSGNTDQGTPPGSYVGRSCNANIALARAHARTQLSLSSRNCLSFLTSLHFTSLLIFLWWLLNLLGGITLTLPHCMNALCADLLPACMSATSNQYMCRPLVCTLLAASAPNT